MTVSMKINKEGDENAAVSGDPSDATRAATQVHVMALLVTVTSKL